MNPQITHRCSYTDPLFASAHSGMIHSVYQKTINVLCCNKLLSLQALGTPLSPLSLRTNLSTAALAEFNFIPDGKCQILPNEVILYDAQNRSLHLSTNHTKIVPSRLSPCPETELFTVLHDLLMHSSKDGIRTLFFPTNCKNNDNQFLILDACSRFLSQSTALLNQKDYRSAAECLSHFIGLGIGLTPSGDDFLCGVLAGLLLCGKDVHPYTQSLKHAISTRFHYTNLISQSFLQCALDSHFSETVCRICDYTSPPELLTAFEEIGHSSGVDSLTGIYYAYSIQNQL